MPIRRCITPWPSRRPLWRSACAAFQGGSTMTERLTLPVLPLREVVLFPGVTAPIGAGRPMTLKAIEAALATPEKLVFAVSQRENVENVIAEGSIPSGPSPRSARCSAACRGMQLLLHGERRGMALQFVEENGHLVAVVRPVEELPAVDPHDPGVHRAAPGGAGPRRRAGPEVRAAGRGRAAGAGRRRRARPLRRPRGRLHRHRRRRSARPCSRPSRSRSGCGACWCTSSGRSACSMPRRTSSRRCRKSWASGSARCTCASSSRRSVGSSARRTTAPTSRTSREARRARPAGGGAEGGRS